MATTYFDVNLEDKNLSWNEKPSSRYTIGTFAGGKEHGLLVQFSTGHEHPSLVLNKKELRKLIGNLAVVYSKL